MQLTRTVTKAECPWLEEDLPAGLEVHKYSGCTYGCVGAGVAVTRELDKTPFFEVPRDALPLSEHNAFNPQREYLGSYGALSNGDRGGEK